MGSAWSTPDVAEVLSRELSGRSTIVQIARDAGIHPADLQTSYLNTREAWLDVCRLANCRGTHDQLQEAVRGYAPGVAAQLDDVSAADGLSHVEPTGVQVEAARASPRWSAMTVISLVVVAVANARGAFGGGPAFVTGAAVGGMIAATIAELRPLRQHTSLAVAAILMVLGAACAELVDARVATTPEPAHTPAPTRTPH